MRSGVCGAVCRPACGAGKDPENKQPLPAEPPSPGLRPESPLPAGPLRRREVRAEGGGWGPGWGKGGGPPRRVGPAAEAGTDEGEAREEAAMAAALGPAPRLLRQAGSSAAAARGSGTRRDWARATLSVLRGVPGDQAAVLGWGGDLSRRPGRTPGLRRPGPGGCPWRGGPRSGGPRVDLAGTFGKEAVGWGQAREPGWGSGDHVRRPGALCRAGACGGACGSGTRGRGGDTWGGTLRSRGRGSARCALPAPPTFPARATLLPLHGGHCRRVTRTFDQVQGPQDQEGRGKKKILFYFFGGPASTIGAASSGPGRGFLD